MVTDNTEEHKASSADSFTPMQTLLHDSYNESLIPFIPKDTRRLLDIGCGSGLLGARVKAECKECEVVGVTLSDAEARAAENRIDKVIVRDLIKEGLSDLGTFDCVVCSHALGYFHDLPRILGEIRRVLTNDGLFIIAVPNILHWRQRLEFLRGRFQYQDSGILHYHYARFFDYETAGNCLRAAGYDIVTRDADGYLPMPLLRKLLGASRARNLDRAMVRRYQGLLSTEFLIVARPTRPAPKESKA